MTVESELKRIGDMLEALVGSQGIVSEAPGDLDKAEDAVVESAPKKKVAKKKATTKKTKVGKDPKPDPEPGDAEYLTIKDDVRPVLKRLRDEVSHAAVKSLLKKHGTSTLPALAPSKFRLVIDEALAELGDDDV